MNTTLRRFLPLLILAMLQLAFTARTSAQAPAWQWVVREGGTTTDVARKVAVDDQGNTFVASVMMGTVTVGSNTYTSAGLDVLLVKYDLSGHVSWSKQFSSTGTDDVSGITFDKVNGVYLTGTFTGATLNYGSGSLANTSAGTEDVYLLRVDGSGNVSWSFSPKATGQDFPGRVWTNGATVLLTGHTQSPNINFTGTALTNGNFDAAFICRLDPSTGVASAAKLFGGGYIEKFDGVAQDRSGNVYVGGSMGSLNLNMDGITLNRLGTNGNFEILLAKLDPTFKTIWAVNGKGTGDDQLNGMTVDDADNVYFTGYFGSASLNFLGTTLTNSLATQEFIVGSVDATGALRWVKTSGLEAQSVGNDITYSGTGIYLCGQYNNAPVKFLNTLTNGGNYDAFVVQMDAAGNYTWDNSFNGAGQERAGGVAAFGCGGVVVGDFTDATIAAGSFSATNIQSGTSDIFTARFAKSIAYSVPATSNACAATTTLDAGAGFSAYLWNTGETTQKIDVQHSGTYSIRVLDNNGCYGTGSTRVSLINAKILASPQSVCKGTPIDLPLDSTARVGTLVTTFSHAMNTAWTENITTVPDAWYRLVVKGKWQSYNMGANSLDAGYMFVTASDVLVRKWQSPADIPAPFVVDNNALRPVNDVYRTDHTYEYRFKASTVASLIRFTEAVLVDNSGSLDFELYRMNDPYTVLWSTGETKDLINVKPAATTTYTATLTDGINTCSDKVTITVKPDNTVVLSSAAGSDAQVTCANSPIAPINYLITGADSYFITGLPPGVSSSFSGNTATIFGTSATPGDYPYTVTLTGGCGAVTTTGKVKVVTSNSISLSSAVGTDMQAVCINTAITPVTYTTTIATGATFSGLPAGVTGKWAANVVTISGTPTVAGDFPYTVTLTGGCGSVTATGTLKVNGENTITLSSAAGTDAQNACIAVPITPITYNTTGATGATVSNLPAGVTYSWAADVLTISGTPTTAGSFPYSISLAGGCGTVSKTGSIKVNGINTVTLTSAPGSDAQLICVNTALNSITYATTGATGATVSGLPAGVSSSWAANVLTISGTPTLSGGSPYTITLNGGCGTVTKDGGMAVLPVNTVTLSSAAGTDAQEVCQNSAITNITYNTTGATGASVTSLPAGITANWVGNVLTISGTPTESGNFTYTISLAGGCGIITKTGTLKVNLNSITLTSAAATDAQNVCLGNAVTTITYTSTGATGANVTGLPDGVTSNWAANKLTISGTPTVPGHFPYSITLTGGCGIITRNGYIDVNAGNTITLTSDVGTDAQAICLNTPLTRITYATTGATNATVTGLPTGVAGKWIANTVTISGTPTAAGSFPYKITLTGGCGEVTTTGMLVVTFSNTVTLSSASGTNAQSLCQGSAIQPITYKTAGATGATVDGLPAGVTANWALNVLTISGTPSVAGNFNYTITPTGGCGTVTEKGSIKVNAVGPASVTIVTASTSVCTGSSVTFNATPVNGGTTPGYRWQVNFTDVVTGGSVFTTSTLKDGDLVCVIMSSNAQCVVNSPAESNIIRMQVNPVPAITATTAASSCGPGTMTLTATPSFGSVNWYAAATNGTALATSNTFTTPAITSTTTYYAEASNLGCVSPTRTAVVATVNPLPVPSITAAAGPEICINSDVNYATRSGMSSYAWTVSGVAGTDYVVKTGGLGASDNSVTLTWLTTGNRSVQVNYTDDKGCTGTVAKADLHVNALPSGAIAAPADLTLCKGDALTLTAAGGATYTWYRNGVADMLNTGSSLSVKEEGTYTAQLISSAGCKAPASGSATVSFKPLPVPAFTVVPACAGSATEFINATSYAGPGTLSFNWDLDDGATATTTDASKAYVKGGSKKVILSATSSACPNSPVAAVSLVTITSSRPAQHVGPIDAVAGRPVTLQARTFGQDYTWSPANGLSDPASDRTDATLSKDATYTVSIKDAGGCVTVDTVSVRVFPGSRIYVPTAFTPNGDGLNDRLFPVLPGFRSLTFFRVYNRFGNLVHQTDKADKDHGWDGRYQGYDQPTGTYIWALRAVDENGAVVDKSGSFTLIR